MNRKAILRRRIWTVAIFILLFIHVYPILFMILSSLKTPVEFGSEPIYKLPKSLYNQNYINAMQVTQFPVLFANTAIVTIASVAASLLLSSMSAFALVKMDWRGKHLMQSFVVIVDDERIVVDSIVQIVDWEHYGMVIVGVAYDGSTALSVIRDTEPDLVITDIRMPGINGFDMIKEAIRIVPNARFVIISAYNDFEYIRSALRLSVYDYIDKPVTLEEMETLLAGLADNHADDANKPLTTQSVAPSKAYIDSNYMYDITLEQLAELCHVTPSYFSLLFKTQVGITYIKYINKVRMTVAKDLLKEHVSIGEVAERTGFFNQHYFNERFKAYWGCTPSDMRKRLYMVKTDNVSGR